MPTSHKPASGINGSPSPLAGQHSKRKGESRAEQKARAERWRKYFADRTRERHGRPYSETQLRKFRKDKKRPRRPRLMWVQDEGAWLKKFLLTLPVGTQLQEVNIPKQKTGAWLNLWNHGIKIAKSVRTDRIYVFTTDGEFLAELEPTDCFNLGLRLLDSVEGLRVKVHRYMGGGVWKEYVVRSYEKWKKDNGFGYAR